MMDPRQFYLQWAAAGNPLAANPYLAGGMRPPGPLPAPYLHSLAQFHNLKALATKTFLEQQNLAKSILQQSQPSHTASASHCECLRNMNYPFTPLLLLTSILLTKDFWLRQELKRQGITMSVCPAQSKSTQSSSFWPRSSSVIKGSSRGLLGVLGG